MIDRQKLLKMIQEELDALKEINPGHKEDGTWAEKGKGKIYSLTKNAEDDVGEDSELEVPARGTITKNNKISSKFGMSSGSPDKQCGKLNIDGSKKKKTRSCKDYPKTYSQVEEKKSTPGRVKQKKDTERRNRFKNRNDLIPRTIDSDNIRKDKLFGDGELRSLAHGIAEEEEDFPYWETDSKGSFRPRYLKQDEIGEVLDQQDEIYMKAIIKRELSAALKSIRAQAAKQPSNESDKNGCSWANIMNALRDIERAEKGTYPTAGK